ncbi:FAD-dependent oxidoreductase [Streptomyces collinus]
MTSRATVAELVREFRGSGRIVIVGASLARLRAAETLPYDRPPLSEQVLKGWVPADHTKLSRMREVDADWRLGVAATGLDRATKQVGLANGEQVPYERLLIATTRARQWPNPADAALQGVHTIRSRDDAAQLIPLGTLDPRQAAPLSDAGLTSYHAVKRSLHLLGPVSTAVVIGAGGLGQMTIQILRALTTATTVVAVDTDPGKLETTKHLGADEALLLGDEAIAHISRGRVGHGRQRPDAPDGCSGSQNTRSPDHRRPRRRSPARQLRQPIRMLVEHFALEHAGEAYQLLHDGKIQGRASSPHA